MHINQQLLVSYDVDWPISLFTAKYTDTPTGVCQYILQPTPDNILSSIRKFHDFGGLGFT